MSDETPAPGGHDDCPWSWCQDPAMAPDIGRFFVAHAEASYISHSELQFGRASAPGRWSLDLATRIEGEAQRAMAGDGMAGMRCGLALTPEGIGGLAFVRFVADAAPRFAVLEDLLIAPRRRGEGFGGRFLDWLRGQCLSGGYSRLFLESGVGNHEAHRFFERQGFAQTSIVMMRDLSRS